MMLLLATMLLVLGALYMYASTSPVFALVGGMTAHQQTEAEAWVVDLEFDLMAAEAVETPVLAEIDAARPRRVKRPMVERPMRTLRPRRRHHAEHTMVCNPYVSAYPALRGRRAVETRAQLE